jgi:hypothetical protein
MDPQGVALCHVEPTQDEELVSSLNTVQALQELLLYDKFCFHACRSALMWSLVPIY